MLVKVQSFDGLKFQLQIVWKNMHFLMWDIGGQDALRSSWDTYYANTEVSVATNTRQ